MGWFGRRPGDRELQSEQSDDCYRFGPLLIDDDEVVNHLMIFAATGGGKTTLIRLLLQDVVPRIGSQNDCRLLMNNPKGDAISILHGIAPSGLKIVILDPFDDRGYAWDMCKDICDPRTALQVVFILIPHRQESQPFFSDAARHLVYGVIISFMHRGIKWTFADLLRSVRTVKTLRRVLRASRFSSHLVDQYLYERRLASNIVSTIATAMLPFEPVAAGWESAEHSISIREWAESGFVLLLGSSDEESVRVINRCMLRRAIDLTLAQGESCSRRSFFVLDELSECGKLDGLVSLLKRGRSKGASAIIAAQSVSGLRSPHLYGAHGAAELVGQVMHKAFGRLECPETAKWASDIIGQQEVTQVTKSRSHSKNPNSSGNTTYNEHVVTQAAVLPSEFMSLPPCNDAEGLSAYYVSGVYGAFDATLPGEELFHRDLVPPSRAVPDYVPRPTDTQYLEPWTAKQADTFAPPLRAPKRSQSPTLKNPQTPEDQQRDMFDDMAEL